MFEFLAKYPTLTVGLGAPVLLGIGYCFRAWREGRRAAKYALYYLLEVWHRLAIFYRTDFGDFFDKMFAEVQRQEPLFTPSDEDRDNVRKHFTPILAKHSQAQALSDLPSFEEQLSNAVSLLASDYPVLAYRLNPGNKTSKFLKFLESYLEDALSPLHNESDEGKRAAIEMRQTLKAHGPLEQVKELEKHLMKLARKVGPITEIQVRGIVQKRKERIVNVPDKEVEAVVETIILPMMYRLNNQMQSTADSGA